VLARVDLLKNMMLDVMENATFEDFEDEGKQRDWTVVLDIGFLTPFVNWYDIR
jgi:hypothetical protein